MEYFYLGLMQFMEMKKKSLLFDRQNIRQISDMYLYWLNYSYEIIFHFIRIN